MPFVVRHRKPYIPPEMEIFIYVVEHGYAGSKEDIKYPKSMMETTSEIVDNSENFGSGHGSAGENYHGEWF